MGTAIVHSSPSSRRAHCRVVAVHTLEWSLCTLLSGRCAQSCGPRSTFFATFSPGSARPRRIRDLGRPARRYRGGGGSTRAPWVAMEVTVTSPPLGSSADDPFDGCGRGVDQCGDGRARARQPGAPCPSGERGLQRSAGPGLERQAHVLVEAILGGSPQRRDVAGRERCAQQPRPSDVEHGVAEGELHGQRSSRPRRSRSPRAAPRARPPPPRPKGRAGCGRRTHPPRPPRPHTATPPRCRDDPRQSVPIARTSRCDSASEPPRWSTAAMIPPTLAAPGEPQTSPGGERRLPSQGPNATGPSEGPQRRITVLVVGVERRVAQNDVEVQIERHPEHVEARAQVRRGRGDTDPHRSRRRLLGLGHGREG